MHISNVFLMNSLIGMPIYVCNFFPMWSVFFQSTSNYHARRFGVRAAMPGFIAKRLCPQLIIVPPNFDKYKAVSTEVSLMKHSYLQPFTDSLSPTESSPNDLVHQNLALVYPFKSYLLPLLHFIY